MLQNYFEISPAVKDALAAKKPVLALESTLLTHGLPEPINVEFAKEAEEIAKSFDVMPATIAILNGKIKIGLTENELLQLLADKNCIKASTRDLPYLLTKSGSAGTTVAATAYCAHLAGIKFFATGGIGGVHRGNDLDISADLLELTRTPIAVICSGAKSILDLPRTIEFLETFSVPIIGYQTEFLPAFYTAKTKYKLPASFDDLKNLKHFLNLHWNMNKTMGVLIANPIPIEDEIPENIIEPAIAHALSTAREKNITGKAITPFLLTAVREITKDASLKANLSLLRNNIKVGAKLAREFP